MIQIATWISNLIISGVSLIFIVVSLFIIWILVSGTISKRYDKR